MVERVVVSGGSGGIGGALCRELAGKGLVPVVGYASGRERAEALARETGGEALALDLTSKAQIEAAVARLSEGAAVTGLVLAGAPTPSLARFGRLKAQEMDLNWQVQVLGPQRLLAAAVQAWFRPRKRGVVLGVLSAAMGRNSAAMSSMGAYVIGKYGLAGVLAAAAADYPWLEVRSACPGFTDTPMLRAFDARFVDGLRRDGRVAKPEHVAAEIADELLAAMRARAAAR